MIKSLIELDINESSYVALKSTSDRPGESLEYGIISSNGTDFYIATKEDGSDGVLWPYSSGSVGPFSMKISPNEDGTLMYVKGTTPNSILLLRYPR
ncbi:MAG: hypothetical protein KJP07_13615 [Desulfatitalea sp.]|nr:hypothetical protein [Desulfatitalea sp.]